MRYSAENKANDTKQRCFMGETMFEQVICIDMPRLAHFEAIATVNFKLGRVILCCILPTQKIAQTGQSYWIK